MKKNMVMGSALAAALAAVTVTGCGLQSGSTNAASAETTAVAAQTAETANSASAQTAESASSAAASGASVSFVNSYDNTQELIKEYPVKNATPIDTDMGEKIENRLLSGFENWNRGYDAWKAWGDILYTDDSIYNVHGARLTLPEYQAAMNATLSKIDIKMGDFNNMVICDDWAAIHYDITTTVQGKENPGSVMEFVHFKDYGDQLGVRVEEGWGGPKDASFDSMCMFQNDTEKKAQQEATDKILNYQIPDTQNLEEKYPVQNPTTDDSEHADAIREAILKDFDSWNQGYDTWSEESGSFYDAGATVTGADGTAMTLDQYKDAVKKADESTTVQKLYFDNMLISGDWAAIHYRITTTDKTTGKKTAGDAMQFLHFAADGNSVKVTESWMK